MILGVFSISGGSKYIYNNRVQFYYVPCTWLLLRSGKFLTNNRDMLKLWLRPNVLRKHCITAEISKHRLQMWKMDLKSTAESLCKNVDSKSVREPIISQFALCHFYFILKSLFYPLISIISFHTVQWHSAMQWVWMLDEK